MVETSVTHLVQRYAPISQLNPYQGNTVSFPDSAKVKVKVAQSCLTLCDPTDYTVLGILQARILEWAAIPFRGSSQPRDRTQVSHIAGGFFTIRATREALSLRVSTNLFLISVSLLFCYSHGFVEYPCAPNCLNPFICWWTPSLPLYIRYSWCWEA